MGSKEKATLADLNAARARQEAREAQLREREAEDLRELLRAVPVETADGAVWWCFIRPPEAFEGGDIGPHLAVVVSARAHGLGLRIDRGVYRRVSGAAMPSDRFEFAGLLRSGECELMGDAPAAKDPPRIGLRLRVDLEECADRSRVVSGQGVRT